MKKQLLLAGLTVSLSLVSLIAYKGMTVSSHQIQVKRAKSIIPSDPQKMAERLSAAIQIETISVKNKNNPHFEDLHQLFQKSFPLIFQNLSPETINKHSLLFKLPGKNPQEPAILLLAHLDVVPIENAKSWKSPPFSGRIDKSYIWGRGAIDDKQSAMAIMEAIEALLRKGLRPERTVYVAFGHDEEIGGHAGALQIAKVLKQRGVQCGFSLDEGLAIVPGSMIGLKPPVALIGLSEKGYLSVELKAEQSGGHSSMPPSETSVGILAKALVQLQRHPFPTHLSPTVREMFTWLAPEMQGFSKFALANLWIFEPLLHKQLSAKPTTNALIRTTMAPTMLIGSPQENVLPAQAQAVINLRLLPGDSQSKVLQRLREVIADPRVKVQARGGFSSEATPESETQNADFKLIHTSIRQVFPDAVVAPSLVLAGTDSRHYQTLCKNQYRFQPIYLEAEDLKRVHGNNERIAISAHAQAASFYFQLLENLLISSD
jgi:carboxypeptidase PM20D1